MIYWKDRVYIAVPKTGSQFTMRCLMLCEESRIIHSGHTPMHWFPYYLKTPPATVFTLRNPWDWYLSYWSYNANNIGSHRKTTDLGFREYLTKIIGKDRREIIGNNHFPKDFGHSVGTYSCTYLHYLTRRKIRSGPILQPWLRRNFIELVAPYITMRIESLEEDIASVFGPQVARHYDAAREVSNVSPHKHRHEMYDNAMRDMVYEKDQSMIDQFGFVF